MVSFPGRNPSFPRHNPPTSQNSDAVLHPMNSSRASSLEAAAAAAASSVAHCDGTVSESSFPAFSRPPLTRKPSIRVRRHKPGALGEESHPDATLPEGSVPGPPTVAPTPSPEGGNLPYRCQRITLHPRGTSQSQCSPTPPRREMAVRTDRSTKNRQRSKLTTLCRPSLVEWWLLMQRGLPKGSRAQRSNGSTGGSVNRPRLQCAT